VTNESAFMKPCCRQEENSGTNFADICLIDAAPSASGRTQG